MDARTWSVVGGCLATVLFLWAYFKLSSVTPRQRTGQSGRGIVKETFWKLDAAGNYVDCFGTTFVAMLEGRTSEPVWARVLGLLEREVGAYYKPLPAASLHVTVKNDQTAGGMRLSSAQFLASLFKKVAFINGVRAACDKFNFRPRARVKSVEVGDTIRAVLTMVDDPEPLRAELTKLGSRPEPGFKFHLTLAYKFVEPDAAGKTKLDDLKKRLEQELIGAGTQQFEKTAFYLHHSMVRFELVE